VPWIPGLGRPRGGARRVLQPTGDTPGQPFSWPFSDIPDAAHYRFGNAPLWRFLPITFASAGLFEGAPYYRTFLRAAKPNGRLLGSPVELAPQALTFFEDAAINGSGRFVVVGALGAAFVEDAAINGRRGADAISYALSDGTTAVTSTVTINITP
jgi:hypothetical protein